MAKLQRPGVSAMTFFNFVKDLATPTAFKKDPSLVWEFYHYRREVISSKSPNPAHKALAHLEDLFRSHGRSFLLATQNIDGLHESAGSRNIIELHGSLAFSMTLL